MCLVLLSKKETTTFRNGRRQRETFCEILTEQLNIGSCQELVEDVEVSFPFWITSNTRLKCEENIVNLTLETFSQLEFASLTFSSKSESKEMEHFSKNHLVFI